MDVKYEFLSEILDEKVYIEQPEGFVDPNERDMVCKLHKALYGLKQASRPWYERFHNYLVQIGFQRTNDNSSLYIKEGLDKKIVLAEIFVDDTLFTRNDDLCKAFSKEISKEFDIDKWIRVKCNFYHLWQHMIYIPIEKPWK